MLVDYISDVHLDSYLTNSSRELTDQVDEFCDWVGMSKGEVLVIAGDIGHKFYQCKAFLTKCADIYDAVVYVHGNHDLYLVGAHPYNDSWERVEEMKSMCRDIGVHYLDGEVVCIQGVRFGGVGMSWDKSYAEKVLGKQLSNARVKAMWNAELNDSTFIMNAVERFDPLELFESEMRKLQAISHCDVVVTHYGPKIPNDLPVKYCNSTTTFFYFDGVREIERIRPKVWIYGHTHTPGNYTHNYAGGSTELKVNPLGYKNENDYCRVKYFEV